MQGKTTFILTDRDTGRVVEKREEHNMVTNALRDILAMPKIGLFCCNMANNLKGYLPMYNNLLHGLMLFGDNIPEKSDDYLRNGRYNVIATAGSAYTGTDAKRGTFNASQSGEFENGYRFVWDFAPEKAIGTIKCASLSSLQSGNQGGSFSAGGVLASAFDITNSSSNRAFAITGSTSGYYMMNYGENCHYFYDLSSSSSTSRITVRKYRMADPDSIGICTKYNSVLEKTHTVSVPYNVRRTFPNVYEGRFYLFCPYGSSGKLTIRVAYIDVETGQYTLLTQDSDIVTDLSGSDYSKCFCAVFNNQLYFAVNSKLYVYNFDGTLAKEIQLSISSNPSFFLKNGKLGLIAHYSPTNSPCYIIPGSEPIYLPNITSYDYYCPHENDHIKYPYVAASYSSTIYIMLRTDYLATINNLSEPLEKTDKHALQVRYEITN